MQLVERHQIQRHNPMYRDLDRLCFLSKNLYNRALYEVRQHYFNTKTFLTGFSLKKQLASCNDYDYRQLPSKVSQQVVLCLEQNFKSFFALVKKKKSGEYDGIVKIPKYLSKTGRFVLIYTNQAISRVELKKGFVKLSGTEIKVKTSRTNINQVRVVPCGDHIMVEIVYTVPDRPELKVNGRYCAIDLGLNNLATVSSNVLKPFIINGRPIKSVNAYFNKKKSEKQSKLRNGLKTSHKLKTLSLKRDNKINDYLHKSSTLIVNQLVSNNISTLIVGYNKGWKQDINIGVVNNQNFVSIPHYKFKQMLKYKCELRGIKYLETEESYTSKCSFLDGEIIGKHDNYKGKRIKRGLFRTSEGKLINADLNGSLNILRNVVGDFKYSIEVCSTPLVYTLGFNERCTL